MITQGLALFTIAGLILNEAIGPWVLGIGIVGWAVYGLCYLDRAKEAILEGGVLIWLVPVLAMLSVVWSDEPALSFRAALETLVMVGCMALIAWTVPPRKFLLLLWLTLVIVAVLSVPFNNLTYDYMARRSNLTGIFENKNTFSTCSAVLVMASAAILLDRREPLWIRMPTIPLIGLGLVQNLQSNSVAASLAMGLSLLWGGSMFTSAWVPQRLRKPYVTGLVVAGLAMLAIGVLVAIVFNEELLALVGKDATLTGRTDLWSYAGRIISTNSILGVGYNAFWIQGHPMAEYLWDVQHVPSGAGFSFHNLYYEVMVELGVPGVLLGGLFIFVTFYLSVRWLRLETSPESIFFFTLLVFILIIQVQGYNLFATFDALYGEVVVVLLYGQNWATWRHRANQARAGTGRARQMTLVRSPNPIGPT